MSVGSLLNSSTEVWRQGRISDGMGGWISGYAKISTVRARFSQPSATERVVASANGADLSHIVYFRAGTDVRRGDQLRKGDEIFEVRATFNPSVATTYLRADCRVRQTSQ